MKYINDCVSFDVFTNDSEVWMALVNAGQPHWMHNRTLRLLVSLCSREYQVSDHLGPN